MQAPFDLFIFGSTSEIMRQLVLEHKDWLKTHTRKIIVSQRADAPPAEYDGLDVISIPLDCADPKRFREELARVVAEHAADDHPRHVISAYGKFSWDYAKKDPVFRFSDDGYQINLVSRLQIIDAFRQHGEHTRFHLFGSLFANFPYTGDYGLSMWYVNQLPKNPEYRDLDMIIYNIGGCRTRFWDYKSMGESNPFLHDEIPTKQLFEAGFLSQKRGIVTFYPTFASRIACFMGRRGVRVL
jgi:hypothetical protein